VNRGANKAGLLYYVMQSKGKIRYSLIQGMCGGGTYICPVYG